MWDVLSWIVSLLVGFLLVGGVIVVLIRGRAVKTRQVLERKVRDEGDSIRLFIPNIRYIGADFAYPKVKNNGVLIVGRKSLYFQNYLEKIPSIVLPLDKIQEVTTASSFRSQPSTLTGGGYLIVQTTDNIHIGFLVKDAEALREEIDGLKK